jgi:hypothetical protein
MTFLDRKGEGRGDVKRTERKSDCGEKSKLPDQFQSPTHIRSGKNDLHLSLRPTLHKLITTECIIEIYLIIFVLTCYKVTLYMIPK